MPISIQVQFYVAFTMSTTFSHTTTKVTHLVVNTFTMKLGNFIKANIISMQHDHLLIIFVSKNNLQLAPIIVIFGTMLLPQFEVC